MTNTIIWIPLDRLLYGIGIALFLVTTLLYISRSKHKESEEEKKLLYYFSIFFIGNGLSMIFFYLADFYYVGSFDGASYIGQINDNLSPVQELVFSGHMINFLISIICTILFESIIKVTRYSLTVIRVVLCIGYIIGCIMNLDIFYIIVILNGVLYTIPLFWLALKSNTEFQNISMMTLIGLMIYFLFSMSRGPEIRELNIISPSFIAFFYMLSIVFYIIPMLIDLERLSKANPLYFWLIFIIVNSLFIILGIYFLTTPSVPIYLPIATFQINIPIFFILLYIFRKNRKNAPVQEIPLLKMFSKPQKVTEEEVSISKERKICLVCKTRVSRHNIYICPGCDTLYCEKCAHTLEGMENACWACETAFNELIPRKTIQAQIGLKAQNSKMPKKGKTPKK